MKALTTLFRVRRRMLLLLLFLRSSLLLAAMTCWPASGLQCWSMSDLLSSALRLLDSFRQRRLMEINVGDGRFGVVWGWTPPALLTRPGLAAKVVVVVEGGPDKAIAKG